MLDTFSKLENARIVEVHLAKDTWGCLSACMHLHLLLELLNGFRALAYFESL